MCNQQLSERCFWITYLYPMRLIVLQGEKVQFSLDEINNCTYNNALLCRIVGSLSNDFGGNLIRYSVCGDGALVINEKIANFTTDDLLLNFNDLLCKILLGGIYVESITSKDLVTGSLHEKNMIWPVNFGDSLSSNMHARIRMKLANNMESIMLDGASSNAKTISELEYALSTGKQMISRLNNISTFYLITGVTEFMYGNWSSAVSNLWIIVEQMTDYLWLYEFLTDTTKNPEIPTRLSSLRQDNRTYSISVKQEILFQIGIISADLYSDLYMIRKARNKLVHDGYMLGEDVATKLYNAVNTLLQIGTKQLTESILPSKRNCFSSFID